MIIDTHKIIHPITNLWRRITRGYGCCDIFSFHYYLAKKIIPGLRGFRKNLNSYPNGITFKEWEAELDKMIWAIQHVIDKYDGKCCEQSKDVKGWLKNMDIHRKHEQEGLELFGKRFRDLWI